MTQYNGKPSMVYTFRVFRSDGLCSKMFEHRHGVKCSECGILTPPFNKRHRAR